MLNKALFGIAVATLISSTATADIFDLSGAESEGSDGDASNTIIDIDIDDGGAGLTVVGFAWALSFEAFSPSFGSEARIRVTSPDGTDFLFSGDSVGWGDAPGIFVDGGDTDVFDGETFAGTWSFRFFESLNDGIDPDGIYHEAIFLIKGVPAPGVVVLLGLSGLLMPRRRRR